jgi:hypothetical protein
VVVGAGVAAAMASGDAVLPVNTVKIMWFNSRRTL